MSDNEKLLINRAKNGDVEAFERLIESYQKKVFNIALRIIGNYDDASDLAQEAFIRIYKSIGGFREQSSFSTWIYRIATNVCLDELRKRKNKGTASLDDNIKLDDGEVKREVEDDGPTPEEQTERNEARRIVMSAINTLSGEHKTAIILRDIQGFSYEEIAKIINCPEGTVKSRINRARQALKEILEPHRELLYSEHVK